MSQVYFRSSSLKTADVLLKPSGSFLNIICMPINNHHAYGLYFNRVFLKLSELGKFISFTLAKSFYHTFMSSW